MMTANLVHVQFNFMKKFDLEKYSGYREDDTSSDEFFKDRGD